MVYPFPPDPRPPAPQWCSKCLATFPPHPDRSITFHAHLLTCGGIQEWDTESTKKKRNKKRRWNGGGLKRTVRMIQKSLSHEGTDTDGESPRKRVRPPPRVVEPVPAVPTHNRTTRFKETKQKEGFLLLDGVRETPRTTRSQTPLRLSRNLEVKHPI